MERLADGGSLYFETDFDHWFVEPWNAFSSLTFLIPVFYLLWKLRGHHREYAFLIFWAAPLMAIGGLGSTIYHAFRASQFFLFMDFVPIALLTISVSIYLWLKVLPHWLWVVLIILVSVGLRFIAFAIFSGSARINTSYFLTGMMIFIPSIIFLLRTRFYEIKNLTFGATFLALALFFRYADDFSPPLLPNGTHWLWHVSTSVGAIFLAAYLAKITKISLFIPNSSQGECNANTKQ
ncbi:MAG: ceramidase [Bacteroidales bacterium]|nr:ceramidase [Bacteroidales bacterium]